MKLVEHESTFICPKKPSWGTGIFCEYKGDDCIIIDFENVGKKMIAVSSIGSAVILTNPVSEDNSDKSTNVIPSPGLRQFNGQNKLVGSKNVVEAFSGEDTVIFNESYVVIGETFKAKKVHAVYDLTVIGDFFVDDCTINGNLTVIGNVVSQNISCQNTFLCNGEVTSESLYVGNDFTVKSIKCDKLICDGNVSVKTTVDIGSESKIDKSIVAFEGIFGDGSFSALNAIANEYFEFEGDISGNIVELETNTTFSEIQNETVQKDLTVEELFNNLKEKMNSAIISFPEMDEDEIKTYLSKINEIIKNSLGNFQNYEKFFERLIDISYKDSISDLNDFLYTAAAKKVLPKELFNYESIEHIALELFPAAEKNVDDLAFVPSSIEEIIYALVLTDKYLKEKSSIQKKVYSKIFESTGIFYSTVESVLSRSNNFSNNSCEITECEQHQIDVSASNAEVSKKLKLLKKEQALAVLDKSLKKESKKYGIEDSEIEKLAAAKVRTVSDLINATDYQLKDAFGKKKFLANHIIAVRDRIKDDLAGNEE